MAPWRKVAGCAFSGEDFENWPPLSFSDGARLWIFAFFLTVFFFRSHIAVPRAPPFGTVVCWEFLLFCVKPLKNEKKIDLFLKFFDFQDLLSHTINV